MRLFFELLREHGINIQDGTRAFRYSFIGEIGTVVIIFDIGQGFADWAIETSHGLLERLFDSITEKLKAEDEIKLQIGPQNEYAALLAYFAMQGMTGKLQNAFFELGLESEKIFEAFVLEVIKLHPTFTKRSNNIELPNISEDVKSLTKSMATERRQFLSAQISSFKHKPQLERLPELYPELLKVWQSAKKIYEDNGESETWRGMVRAKYPELTFDDDLLTRVSGGLDKLPEDIQAKLAKKDGDHTPYTIALEHAARMCNAPPYQYGVRYLYKLAGSKTEQGESDEFRKTVSAAEQGESK